MGPAGLQPVGPQRLAHRYTFKDGTISLINAMIEDGKPEVRSPVKVEDKGDHVVVTTQKGERIVAGSVVLALPMNVLPNVSSLKRWTPS